jgi:hypothetical protein
MHFLLPVLFISLATAQTKAPDCRELKPIVQQLEKTIQEKRLGKECDQLEGNQLGLASMSPLQVDTLKKYRCMDLAAVEMQLRSIENELALFQGIASLQAEIESGVKKVKENKRPELAQQAAGVFMENLQVAQTLELLLATNNGKKENFFLELKDVDPKSWDTPAKFGKYVASYCTKYRPVGDNICSKNFTLTPKAYEEIKAFMKVGAQSEGKFKKRQIEELSDALSIKKGKEKYSYAQMAAELKGVSSEGIVSKDGIESIKNLPDFKASKEFDFLNQMKAAKDQLEVQTISSRFGFFLDDLKKRQTWEMKSKLALIIHDVPKAKELCQSAWNDQGSISDCLTGLVQDKSIPASKRAHIDDMIYEFKYGENHVEKLNKLISECIPSKEMEMPPGCFGELAENVTRMQEKSIVLNALRAKMLEDSANLLTLRNFAVEKYQSQNCGIQMESSLLGCYDDLGAISKEAVVLAEAGLDLAVVYAMPDKGTNISELCDDENIKIYKKDRLCSFEDDPVADHLPAKKDAHSFNAPVDPESRNTTRQAILETAGNLIGSFGQMLGAANMQRPPNPYPMYPYNPYPSRPTLSISDSLILPAAMKGYGQYAPTPGLMPYSSINRGPSTYAPYGSSSSSHFGAPVGW